MTRLEEAMLAMQTDVAKLLSKDPRGHAGRAQAARSKAADAAKIGPPPGLSQTAFEGLDPQVVKAAQDSGIPDHQLQEMANLVRRHPQRMGDIPRENAGTQVATPLDESGEEEDIDGLPLDAPESSNGQMEKAILQLTKVCNALAQPQMKRSSHIEQILDNAGLASSSDGAGTMGARKNATALRALKRCLLEQPEYIYQTVENALLLDFQSRALRPGEPLQDARVGGWKAEAASPTIKHMSDGAGLWEQFGMAHQGPCEGSESPLLAIDSSSGPNLDRRRFLASLRCGFVRTTTTFPCLRRAQCAKLSRTPTFCSDRPALDGAVSQPCEGDGQLPGDKEEAVPTLCCSESRKRRSRGESQAESQEQRKRKREKQSGGRCRGLSN